MFIADGELVFSASDLTGFLECELLPSLNREVAVGERAAPLAVANESLAAMYGDRYERSYLAALKSSGMQVVELARPPDLRLEALRAAHDETVAALASGAEVVYQGTLFVDGWLGHPDFLVRRDDRAGIWPHSYDVYDTKLARHAKASALLQVALYADQLQAVQGCQSDRLVLALGDGSEVSFSPGQVASYLGMIKLRFVAALSAGKPYPYPVAHCAICRWSEVCDGVRRGDDHLSLVAGIRREHVRKLEESEVRRLIDLAEITKSTVRVPIGSGTLDRLARQAGEQRRSRVEERVVHTLLEVEPGHGLLLLPPPDPGDVFFDMEGFPYEDEGGLEYLFGWVTTDGEFHHRFASDRPAEKRAFEDFMDEMSELIAQHPRMHIYHYATYERTALSRLSSRHATREEEVADLLRRGVLVDLYQVVRQGLVVGAESYSIKALEPLYGFARHEEVKTADESLIMYQAWLDSEPRDDGLLAKIADYNEVDCRSTLALRDWLLSERAQLTLPPDMHIGPADTGVEELRSEKFIEWIERVESLASALTTGISEDPQAQTPEEHASVLLAHLLKFHQREAAAQWRDYFSRLALSPQELCDLDHVAIGELRYEGLGEAEKQSQEYLYSFPLQEIGIRAGDSVIDPATGSSPGTLVRVESPSDRDPLRGVLVLRRRASRDVPHPYALIPGTPISDYVLRDALCRLADWVVEYGVGSTASICRAARQILLRMPPHTNPPSPELLSTPPEHGSDAVVRISGALDHGSLPVQGPPGSGKTYSAVQVIAEAVTRGQRVGVTSNSHRVIDNVLEEVASWAAKHAKQVNVVHKGEPAPGAPPGIEYINSNPTILSRLEAGTIDVLGGTAWLMALEAMDQQLDLLVIDEAGQVSLANALASAGAARNLLLVGDPAQLDQPTQAAHPDGSGASALAHVLADAPTMPGNLGVFLEDTRRMHPSICRFISDVVYAGRLESIAGLERQAVTSLAAGSGAAGEWLLGSGLRYVPVTHEGHRNSSSEEAEAVSSAISCLVGGTWIDADGTERPLKETDVLVVAPYNAQVALLRSALPGIEVGTVDRFQGRQAAVVFYSMATSSSEELPREFEFLYSLNRLNVAVSRAQALAILVCSPKLLTPRCTTTRQIELVNALCRFVEVARDDPVSS